MIPRANYELSGRSCKPTRLRFWGTVSAAVRILYSALHDLFAQESHRDEWSHRDLRVL
jgi:hypothetical protein